MTDDDTIMTRINEGIALAHSGRREEARALFDAVWRTLEHAGDPFHRCVLAHFMADMQDEPRDELVWDLRALAAAGELSDERVKQHHASMSLAGLFPSLHLNAGDAYRRVGDAVNAREHAQLALEACTHLPADPSSTTTRAAIRRLSERLDGEGEKP